MIDLHVHSTYSDGTFTPTELVEYALTHDISAFALTDHDTAEGVREAMAAAALLSGRVSEKNPQGRTLEVIPGIEFSTCAGEKDIHIVGLYIDTDAQPFVSQLAEFVASRERRNQKMCSLLQECGIDIDYEAFLSEYPDAVITRAHYAGYLLEHGYVQSRSEAFDKYLGDGARCYVPREKVTPEQAVRLIRRIGGIPVLAHPTLYHMENARLEALVSDLKEAGLMAIECFYSSYSGEDMRRIQAIARRFDLLAGGGSDFHGDNKPGLHFGTGYGNLYLHEDILKELKKAL